MRRWGVLAACAAAVVAVGLFLRGPDSSSGDRPAAPATGAVDLVQAVRAAGAARDFVGGADLVAADRAVRGVTPENLEALSWLGRNAATARDFDRAERFARETYDQANALLATRTLDAEPRLPIALGAAIEVLSQVAVGRGARTEAVSFLEGEVARYRDTSIAKRIQKNINLISLEGTRAPSLDASEYLTSATMADHPSSGRVVLMFFWAHWCSDCKAQAPILADLMARYGARGLTVVAPTERFGYVAGGREAPPDEERAYIAQVRETFYPMLADAPIPLAAGNHQRFGVSTTPTIVLVDRAGVIRLYHPGQMSAAELEPLVRDLVEGQAPPRS